MIEDKPLNEVKKYDIDISNAHQVMAWRVFMNWCFCNDLVDRNPFLGIPVVYGKRDRVLTPEEIKKIWHYEDNPFSDIVKVLILTGGRREEVFHFEPVSNGFYLPAEKAKNHTAILSLKLNYYQHLCHLKDLMAGVNQKLEWIT